LAIKITIKLHIFLIAFRKVLSIKDVRSQGREGFVQCGHFADKWEGVLLMQTYALPLFGAKYFRFFEIYGVFAQTRGRELSQCGQFSDKGG